MIPAVLSLLAILNPAGPRVDAYGDPLPPGVAARLGSVRWLCPDAPDHLIWSPDGKYLVGTHGGKSLTIWAYPAGTVAGRFEIPDPPWAGKKADQPGPFTPTLSPQQVRFRADSRSMLVYGGENQLFRVRLPDGRAEQINTGGHRGLAVAISADGRRALLEMPKPDEDGYKWSELCVLDLGPPARLRTLWKRQVHRPDGLGVEGLLAPVAQVTSDGRYVVAASGGPPENSHKVFDLFAGWSRPAPGGAVYGVAIVPDGRSFLSTHDDGRMTRWAFAEPRWVRPGRIAGPFAQSSDVWYEEIYFTPDGRTAVRLGVREGGRDKHAERSITAVDVGTLRTVREWSYRIGDEILVRKGEATVFGRDELGGIAGTVIPIPDSRPRTCAVAPDNRTLAIASFDSPRIRFFDLRTGTEARLAGGHAAGVVALRRAGSKLISVSSDQVGRVWELPRPDRGTVGRAAGRELEAFDRWDENDLPPAPPSEARVKVVYDRDQNCLEARDTRTEAVVWEREAPQFSTLRAADRPRTLPMVIDSVWDRVAFAAGEAVSVCELVTGETVAEVRVPGCWPTAVEFAPDVNTLFVGYHDGQVLVWDLRPADLPRRTPSDSEFRQLWADLGGSPRAAARTRSAFLDDPAATLRWLDANLRPLPRPTEFEIDWWLAKLAHPKFAEREEATRQLVRHFDVAGPAVAEMLAATRSPEVEHRLRMVIDRQAGFGGDGEVVRLVRAVTILERMGTPDANKLLLRIARGGGVPAGRAANALVRIKEREKAPPVNHPQRAVTQPEPPH